MIGGSCEKIAQLEPLQEVWCGLIAGAGNAGYFGTAKGRKRAQAWSSVLQPRLISGDSSSKLSQPLKNW